MSTPFVRPTIDAAAAGRPGAALSRRSLVQGIAWSLPVVTVAAAAPAFAASPPPFSIEPNQTGGGGPVEVERCQPVALGALSFTAMVGSAGASNGETVTINLPAGLAFVAGGQSAGVQPTNGIAQVPAFVSNGAAGTYTITAVFHGLTATQTVVVTPAPGTVVEIRRSTAAATGTATFAPLAVAGISTAVAGAIQGDQSAVSNSSTGANGAVLTSAGTVRYWGNHTGSAATAPGTLRYNNADLTGLTMLDSWTSLASGNSTAGGVAATDSTKIYSWWHSGTGAPIVVRVIAVTGNLIQVRAEDGFSYALTSTGVWRWANVASASGTTPTVTASLIANTAGARTLSTWSTRGPGNATLRYGGAALLNTAVATWVQTNGAATTTATVTPMSADMTGVTKLLTSDSGMVALTASGGLWTYGAGFGGNTWVQRVTSGVADFSFWGFSTDKSYVGGLWIDALGQVTQFFGNGTWSSPALVRLTNKNTGTALTGITKTFSSDGTYLALKSDGTVYAWGGNLDNSGRGPAVSVGTGNGRVTDLNVWGHHIGDVYYGGGYVIKADVATC